MFRTANVKNCTPVGNISLLFCILPAISGRITNLLALACTCLFPLALVPLDPKYLAIIPDGAVYTPKGDPLSLRALDMNHPASSAGPLPSPLDS